MLALAAVLTISSWALPETLRFPSLWPHDYEPFTYSPKSYPLQQVVPDERPAFRIDPDQSWSIKLGRGSTMSGLATVKIDSTGRVVLHRLRVQREPSGDRMRILETATVRRPGG